MPPVRGSQASGLQHGTGCGVFERKITHVSSEVGVVEITHVSSDIGENDMRGQDIMVSTAETQEPAAGVGFCDPGLTKTHVQ